MFYGMFLSYSCPMGKYYFGNYFGVAGCCLLGDCKMKPG